MIAEYLLPPSNILPRTYRDLSTIMKYIGMEYQAIDACPNDHIIYYKQYDLKQNALNVIAVDIEQIK